MDEDYHHSSKIKPPTYDGKTSWQTYMKQFDAAANVNNWSESEKATALIVSLRGDALEILQTLNEDQHKNYEDLVLQLEMRFGDKHLQQYEADIARLVYLAYPTAPRDFIEQLEVQGFIDGIRDCETQQALQLARCKKLNEVLAYALEFEAAKQASRGTRIRQIRTRTPEREYRSNNAYNRMEQADRRNQTTSFRRKVPLECWNCGEKGHIRPRCPRLGSEQAPLTRFYQAPLSKIKVSRLRNDGTSLVVYGKVCGRDCQMVIDTGSYHTIVKPNILAHCKMKPTTNNFILETAGGETLPVIGVHEAEFQLGRTVFRHQVFVANITDDVLMGLELMKKHGFQLNLQERSIKTGQDEIIISMPRSDEKDDGQVELIEPDLDEDIVKKGLLVAKTLTQRKNNTVPVRLVNLKNCDQKLKNGDVLGKSQAVTCITKCEDIGEGPSYCDNEEIPEKGQIARWLQRLQEYDFKIEHRKGRLHGNADAISRRPCAERCSHCKRAENKEFGSHCRRTAVVNDDNWETKKLCEEQQKDEDIKPFIAWKEEGTRPEWKDISNKSTTLKGYWAIWDSLIVEDGILKRLWENTDGKEIRKQIVLPRARVNEVLQEVHGGVGGGVELMSKIGVDGVLSVPVAKDQEPEAEGK
ncbi:hypothetical protein NQ317_016750 [Molorchus minor]|uniref:CCHC-type domain-containing protein n=1 Tax=Molorchus minor TaxID=1323400 RepID=A0ABQ9JP03_9CUCU|nr:hypothetical protein NQ317_016750 [Molorchus minor]